MRRLQLGLTALRIVEINPRGMQKNARILSALKQLTAGVERIWVHPTVRSAVTHQITYFDPLRPNNVDDILDILAYLYQVIAENKSILLRPLEMLWDTVEAAGSEELVEQLEF